MGPGISTHGVILLVINFLFLLFIFVFALLFRYKKRKENILKTRLSLEQEIVRTQLEIQEQTFHKISQEIHDNIGQMLSLSRLFLGNVIADKSVQCDENIKDSHQLIGRSIQALRDLSHTLNSDYVSDLGFLRAVEFELELIRKTGRLRTELNVSGEVKRLNSQKELILFRILQETINNTIKHAEAQKIIVDVSYGEQCLWVRISDDGKGFKVLSVPKGAPRGIGMKNIQTRAKLIGAKISVNSEVGKGTETVIDCLEVF